MLPVADFWILPPYLLSNTKLVTLTATEFEEIPLMGTVSAVFCFAVTLRVST